MLWASNSAPYPIWENAKFQNICARCNNQPGLIEHMHISPNIYLGNQTLLLQHSCRVQWLFLTGHGINLISTQTIFGNVLSFVNLAQFCIF